MTQLTWLITGSSPGSLGDDLARAILAREDKVIATARNIDKLDSLREAGAQILQLDVTSSQHELNQKAQEALSLGSVDVLVNNAGVASMSTIEELS